MSPTRYALSDKLFIAYYKKTIKKITPYIIIKRYLNFIIDKFCNIHKKQV